MSDSPQGPGAKTPPSKHPRRGIRLKPDPERKPLNYDAVRAAAQGRWPWILAGLGVDPDTLKDDHGPCPGCGGVDRFRFDDKDQGHLFLFCGWRRSRLRRRFRSAVSRPRLESFRGVAPRRRAAGAWPRSDLLDRPAPSRAARVPPPGRQGREPSPSREESPRGMGPVVPGRHRPPLPRAQVHRAFRRPCGSSGDGW